MTSKHYVVPVSRSPLRHKQHATSSYREQQPKCGVKPSVDPSVGVQTHSRHSSAGIDGLTERSDKLHQDFEHDKQNIHDLYVDVTKTSEEYNQLCHELGKREEWHRTASLSTTVNDVQRKLTELESKLLHYSKENSKLKDGNNELKWRIKGLKGRRLFLTEKQKSIKEQTNSPKNLKKRAKAQGVTISRPSHSRITEQDLSRCRESAKAEKSEIEVLFFQYQSELNNLIKTEKRLKEIINELQASHVAIKIDIQKLKEIAANSSKKHKKKEVVQRTVTKQANQNNHADVLQQPSQSDRNLDIMIIEAKSQLAVEEYRAKLDVKEAELKKFKGTIESLEKRNQLEVEEYRSKLDLKEAELNKCKAIIESLEERLPNQSSDDANKLNYKFQEQLVQTNQQLEAKWTKLTKERDERLKEISSKYESQKGQLSEANKNIVTMKAEVAVKEKEIETCNKRLKEISAKHELQKGQLSEVNRSIEAMRAELAVKDREIETCNKRLKEISSKYESQKGQLSEANRNIVTMRGDLAVKDKEIKTCNKRLEKISNDNSSLLSQLTKANENYKSMVAQKDLELKNFQERLEKASQLVAQKDLELKNSQERLKEVSSKYESQEGQLSEANRNIVTMRADLAVKDKEIKTCNKRLKEISTKCESQEGPLSEANKNIVKTTRADLAVKDKEIKTCNKRIEELEIQVHNANDTINQQKLQFEHQMKELQKRLEKLSTGNTSALLKATKANEHYKLLLTEKDLQWKQCQDRLNEVSAKHESQKAQLIKANRSIETMRTELAVKDREIDTYNNKLTENLKELSTTKKELSTTKEKLSTTEEELSKTKGELELAQQDLIGHAEVLKNDMKRYENIPKKALMEKLVETERELKKYQESLLRYEEKSFKFTNAFTSAGEGSVLDISKRYRHLQHNKRAAAARAIKKVHKIDAREHLCTQIMDAYEIAKSVVLHEAKQCIENSLFKLIRTEDEMTYRNKELLQCCMMLLSCIHEDETIHKAAVNQIYQKLIADGKPLQSEVLDYYHSLAELTWCAVARPIPMIIAVSPETYNKACHELKDGEDVEDGCAISYIYPVLYSSNEYPPQVAQEGKVVLVKNADN